MAFFQTVSRGAIAECIGVLGMTALVKGGMAALGIISGGSVAAGVLLTVMAFGIACMFMAVAMKVYGALHDKKHEEASALHPPSVAQMQGRAPERSAAVSVPEPDATNKRFAEKYMQEKTCQVPGSSGKIF